LGIKFYNCKKLRPHRINWACNTSNNWHIFTTNWCYYGVSILMASPSRLRRRLAVNTARDYACKKDVSDIISKFDERQLRIFYKYIPQFQSMYIFFETLDRDLGGQFEKIND